MPLRPCLVCKTRPATQGSSRCELHALPRNGWGPKPDYYDRDWDRLSKSYREAHPICEEPGCTKSSEETDHIIGVRAAPHLRLERSNLRALCVSHHREKTGRTRYASAGPS